MAVAPEATRADLAPAASDTAEQLFQEHAGWIYGYCLRLLRSPEEAEDALQTTYLNACRSLSQGTRPEVGSAWLLRIAQNVCFARMRSSGRRGRLERPQDFTVLEQTVPAPERSADELIGLTDALVSIPERQREAILLREWQGLSYSEVGARLGLSQSAVETLIFRARRSLAGALEAPAKRGRRKALHALDVGGLAAALKGFFAGSAGIKTVAAVTAAVATTAVVATDPAGVWRDRPVPSAADAAQAEQPRTAAPAAAATSPAAAFAAAIVAPSETARGPLTAPPGTRRGGAGPAEAPGRSAAGNGKGKAKGQAEEKANGNGKARRLGAGGNGNGKALGLSKQTPTGPGSGQGTPAGGQANRPEPKESGARATPPGKSKGAKGAGASKSR